MVKGIHESESWYYIPDASGYWVTKNRGTGRALRLLLENMGNPVSLEEIERVSRWKHPRRDMRQQLTGIVNNWSDTLRIETSERNGQTHYTLYERKN